MYFLSNKVAGTQDQNRYLIFFISNFCLVLIVVFFLLCDSPASEFYVPMFRNNLLDLCKQEE